MGIVHPNRFPALTVMSSRSALLNVGAWNRGLAITGTEASLGSLCPPLFTAITLNSYSSPSVRFGTVPFVALPGISMAFSQVLQKLKLT